MNNIDINNYDSFLYLYNEGELDAETRLQVEAFLDQHPEIKQEMDEFYDPKMVVTAAKPQHHFGYWRIAVAASLLLAVGGTVLYQMSHQPSQTQHPVVAQLHTTPQLQGEEATADPIPTPKNQTAAPQAIALPCTESNLATFDTPRPLEAEAVQVNEDEKPPYTTLAEIEYLAENLESADTTSAHSTEPEMIIVEGLVQVAEKMQPKNKFESLLVRFEEHRMEQRWRRHQEFSTFFASL